MPQNSISESEFALFRDYILENSGILISPEKAYLIETRLSKLMVDAGSESFGEFYQYIISGADPALPQKIINEMSTNETLWFRDGAPWKVLEEHILPGLVEAVASGEKARARIWSAAVSTGQEIYSTVMCIDNYLSRNNIKGVSLSDFDFCATDISSRVLDTAKKGRYDAISIMRGLNDYYKNKYFEKSGAAWLLEPRIRDAVKFTQFNLQKNYQIFGTFDVIFCRYVLIYFTAEQKRDIISKMHKSLHDRGILFTGNYSLYEFFNVSSPNNSNNLEEPNKPNKSESNQFHSNYYENLTYYSKIGSD
jgi:chemotaxis protein methyltransferase CheR